MYKKAFGQKEGRLGFYFTNAWGFEEWLPDWFA